MKKEIKVSVAKALDSNGYTAIEIANLLGLSDRQVYRYLKEQTPEEWQESVEDIKRMVRYKEEESAARTLSRIDDLVPKADFRDLVGWYKIVRDVQRPTENTNIQVNNIIANKRQSYGI